MQEARVIIGILAGILAFSAEAPYVVSILRHRTRPERAAYSIWAMTSTITFIAYWADGATDSLWFAVGDFLVGITMFVLAMKYGYKWVRRRDTPGLVLGLLGVVLWVLTDEPFYALLLSVAVDVIGSTLVAIKSYEAPATENLPSWLIYLLAALLACVAVGSWDFSLLFFPAYAALSSVVIVGAILLGRRAKH